MGELVTGIPTTFVSEHHGCVVVHRGIKWHCCNVDRMRADGTFKHKDHATSQTDVVRWRDDGKTQLVQINEMEITGIRMEVGQQTC